MKGNINSKSGGIEVSSSNTENIYPNPKIQQIRGEISCHVYKNMFTIPCLKDRYVVVQIETSGYETNDSIEKIYACEVQNGKITTKKFQKDLGSDAKTPLKEFLKFTEDSPLVSHDALFLMKFLNKSLTKAGLATLPETRFLCTMRMFVKNYVKDRKERINLGACCENFGISTKVNQGLALRCKANAELFIEMVEKDQGNQEKRKKFKMEQEKSIKIRKEKKMEKEKIKKEREEKRSKRTKAKAAKEGTKKKAKK